MVSILAGGPRGACLPKEHDLTDLVRRLTAFEASFALPWHRDVGDVLPMNCYVAVRLKIDPSLADTFDARAQEAVLEVQKRHPLLRMSIGREPSADGQELGFLALYKTDVSLKLEIRPSQLDTATLEQVSAECLGWIDTRSRAPLCKIIALKNGDTCVIYFTMSHAIFDGRSSQIIAEEFLELLADPNAPLAEVDEATEGMSFKDIMVIEDVTPAGGFMDHVTQVMAARPEEARLAGESSKIEVQQGTGSLLVELNAKETAFCAARAKEMGVTFNSLACAAWARTVPSDPRFNVHEDGTQFLLFVADARRALPPKYASTLAQIMGPGFATVNLAKPPDDQCAYIEKIIKTTVANNWHFLPTTRDQNDSDDPTRWATAPIGELSTTFPKANAALSNLGRLAFAETSAFQVERTWLAGGLYPDSNLVCQAATTAGVCTFTIQYVMPAHSKADAKKLAKTFKRELGL